MAKISSQLFKMVQNASRWLKLIQNKSNWLEIGKIASKRFKLVQTGSKIVSIKLKSFQICPKFYKWVTLVQIVSNYFFLVQNNNLW